MDQYCTEVRRFNIAEEFKDDVCMVAMHVKILVA